MEIPVYLFTGFLESGKTKFIQDTLEDPRFTDGTSTLLLVCEQGETEYNEKKYPADGVHIEYIENEEDLDEKKLEERRSGCYIRRCALSIARPLMYTTQICALL